jgi:hypothetical protein
VSDHHVSEDQMSAVSMEVGFATRDITPAIGKHIPGLFGPRVSTGVLDPLLATACVIREGDRVAAIVGADAVFTGMVPFRITGVGSRDMHTDT